MRRITRLWDIKSTECQANFRMSLLEGRFRKAERLTPLMASIQSMGPKPDAKALHTVQNQILFPANQKSVRSATACIIRRIPDSDAV